MPARRRWVRTWIVATSPATWRRWPFVARPTGASSPDVAELMALQDVAALVGEERAHRAHDAGTVDAREGEDVAHFADVRRSHIEKPASRNRVAHDARQRLIQLMGQ